MTHRTHDALGMKDLATLAQDNTVQQRGKRVTGRTRRVTFGPHTGGRMAIGEQLPGALW